MYITLYKKNVNTQNNLDYSAIMQTQTAPNNTHYKITLYIKNPVPRQNLKLTQQQYIEKVENYIKNAWQILAEYEHNYEDQYYEFKIPKHSGGLRTINAPNENFKMALSRVKDIFEQNIKCLAHDTAYAYTKQRSTIDALKKHQLNNSNWYLKIDLTDFFPSCTPEIIYTQLKQLYPFYYISDRYNVYLSKIIKTCCLNNGLPQGTPMSPLLTNLIMVPYDYVINSFLKRGTGEHYVYTRYADDILISSKANFDWKTIEHQIENILVPFKVKRSKTRYGSKAGSNWNLGLMINKDNNITLGTVRKKQLNAMLNNFIKDFKNNVVWSKEDVQHLQGQLSYLQQIEPAYYNYIINKYQNKYNTPNYKTLIKSILNN